MKTKKVEVKFKKLSDKAVTPSYAYEGDACMDLTSVDREHITEGSGKDKYEYMVYKFDLAFEIPKGYAILVFPRSSISKTGLILANSVGVIDSGYRGPMEARFKYVPGYNLPEVGEKVVQIKLVEVPNMVLKEVDELSPSDRGSGGFGSSGK